MHISQHRYRTDEQMVTRLHSSTPLSPFQANTGADLPNRKPRSTEACTPQLPVLKSFHRYTSTASRSSHPHALQTMSGIRPLPPTKHSLAAGVLGGSGRISWVIALCNLSREHADLWVAHRPVYL